MGTVAETPFREVHITLPDRWGNRNLTSGERAEKPLLFAYNEFDSLFNFHRVPIGSLDGRSTPHNDSGSGAGAGGGRRLTRLVT